MFYTTDQAFDILKENGITSSKQQITKWIRQGKLKAIPYEKNKPQTGYRISHECIQEFIEDKRLSREQLLQRVKELESEVAILREEIQKLTMPKKRGRRRKEESVVEG